MTNEQTARLRKGRRLAGLTQKDAAKKLNVSFSTYRGWEKPNGSEPNTTAKLIELCDTLNISIDWLLTGKSCNLTPTQAEALSRLLQSFTHKKSPINTDFK